jgi:hypothetical protein
VAVREFSRLERALDRPPARPLFQGTGAGLPESRITGVTLRDATVAAENDFAIRDADPPVFERVTTVIDTAGKK